MRTAVFDQKGVLLGIYESKSAAREAHKGVKGLHFINKDNFQPIGAYGQVGELFPAEPEAPPAAAAPAGTPRIRRAYPELKGEYVIGTIGARATMEDPRSILVDAIVKNTTFEGYLKTAPAKVDFTTASGKIVGLTASHFMVYALQRGWVKFPEGSEAAATMIEIQESMKSVRETNAARKKAATADAVGATPDPEPAAEPEAAAEPAEVDE